MKTLYSFLIFLMSGLMVYAQNKYYNATPAVGHTAALNDVYVTHSSVGNGSNANASQSSNKKSTVIWSEDFANGLPSTWTYVDSSGINPWKYSDHGSCGFFQGNYPNCEPAPMFTSAGNGFIASDPDSANQQNYGQPSGTTYQYLSSFFIIEKMDLSSYPGVLLEFEQYFRFNNTIDLKVEVSTDSSTWTTFTVQGPDAANNAASPDPDHVSVNISAVAGGQSTVWIRFAWSARVYFWAIDDIQLVEAEKFDLSMEDFNTIDSGLLEYTQYPLTMANDNVFRTFAGLRNNGAKMMTNATYVNDWTVNGVNVNNVTASAFDTLLPGVLDTTLVTNRYTPLYPGRHNIQFLAQGDSADTKADNDTTNHFIIFTDTTFGKDNLTIQNGYGLNGNPFEYGSIYYLPNEAFITNMHAYIHPATSPSGQNFQVYAAIYQWDTQQQTQFLVDRSPSITLTSLDSGRFVTIEFANPVQLPGGNDYFFMFGFEGTFDNGPTPFIASGRDLRFGQNFAFDPAGVLGNAGPNSWYTVPWTVILWASMQNSCSVTASFTETLASCGAADGSLVAAGNGGSSPYNFLWETGSTSATLSNIAAGTYTVTVSDNEGCFVVDSFGLINSGGASLTVTPTDVSCNSAAEAGSSTDGQLSVAATGGTSPYTYLWSDGGNSNAITGKSPGSYNVTVTDNMGCISTASGTVAEPTAVTATLSTTPGSSDVQVTANPSGGTSPYTYLWGGGGGSNQSATYSCASPAPTYTVSVFDGGGCRYTFDTDPLVCTGIDNPEETSGIDVYPNPSNGAFSVLFNNVESGVYDLEIKNVLGQQLFFERVSVNASNLSKEMEISDYQEGIYFLTISDGENELTTKLILK